MRLAWRWRVSLKLRKNVLVATVMIMGVVLTEALRTGPTLVKNELFSDEKTSYFDGPDKSGSDRSLGNHQAFNSAKSTNSKIKSHSPPRQTSSVRDSMILGINFSSLQYRSSQNQLRRQRSSSDFDRFHRRRRRFTIETSSSRHDVLHEEERASRNNSSALPSPDIVEYRTAVPQSNQNNKSTKIYLKDFETQTKLEHYDVSNETLGVSLLSKQTVLPLVNFSQLALRKCNCPKNHVSILNESGNFCSAVDAAIIDVLVRPIYNEIISVGESSFASVKVENMTCNFPQEIFHMTEKEFILLLSGKIRHEFYNTLIEPDNYCLEFIQYPDGMREWVAMACLQPPYIKKCCQEGYTFDNKRLQCFENLKDKRANLSDYERLASVSFQPSLEKDEALVHFGVDLLSKRGFPACSEGETAFGVELGMHSGNLVKLIHFLHEIKLFVSHDNFSIQKYYKNSEFCIDKPAILSSQNESEYMAVFCYDNPHVLHHNICTKKNKHCIRKCCPHNQIIDMVSIGCREPLSYDYIYKPNFYKSSWYDHMVPISKDIPYEVVFGEPLCHPVDAEEESFYLLDDGTMYLPRDNVHFSSEDYCVDARQGYFNQTDVVVHYCPFQGLPFGDSCWRLRVHLYPITLMVSCVFLLFTLILYKVVPELRMNISGKSLVSHVFSLLVAFLCLLVIFVGRLSERNAVLCQVMAFVTQYSYLATFFWLSAMCFEMWYRIRFLPTRAVSPSESRYKYKIYSAYGWGLPALITGVTGAVHAAIPLSDQSSLTPNFGNPYCWFRDEPATWLYFSGIVTLLCVANIFFFLDLANISLKQCLGSSLIHVSRQQHMERILLCLKLFIVMGVTWIFEEISYQDSACARWIPTDLMNILRGPCVFLSVVSTRSVINKLKTKREALHTWLSDRGAPFLSRSPSKGPSAASLSHRATNMGLARARGFSQARQRTESGSHNSLASLKTQETSIDPKSDSSSSSNPQEMSDVYHRETSVLTQDSECSSATENNEVISQSPCVLMSPEKDSEASGNVCPPDECRPTAGGKAPPKTYGEGKCEESCAGQATDSRPSQRASDVQMNSTKKVMSQEAEQEEMPNSGVVDESSYEADVGTAIVKPNEVSDDAEPENVVREKSD